MPARNRFGGPPMPARNRFVAAAVPAGHFVGSPMPARRPTGRRFGSARRRLGHPGRWAGRRPTASLRRRGAPVAVVGAALRWRTSTASRADVGLGFLGVAQIVEPAGLLAGHLFRLAAAAPATAAAVLGPIFARHLPPLPCLRLTGLACVVLRQPAIVPRRLRQPGTGRTGFPAQEGP